MTLQELDRGARRLFQSNPRETGSRPPISRIPGVDNSFYDVRDRVRREEKKPIGIAIFGIKPR